ncbi:MAG: hypothetical protein WKF86_09080 [Acidimicrobiales bacterium]
MAAHASEAEEAARSAVQFHMSRLAEDGDLVTGELVPRHSALVRRYYVHEAKSCIIWLRAEQYHCLNLIAIQPDDR